MLTNSERVHFDLNGFVLLKKVLSEEECQWIAHVAAAMKQTNIYPRYDSPNQTVLFGPAWYDRRILSLAMEPRLRAKAEDIVGGSSRLEESSFLIYSPQDAQGPASESRRWHRGLRPDFGSFESGAHYHCLFSKMILYLSPRGPMTGTWVVPGSHKLQISVPEFERVFHEDMARYVDAELGDVLLFGETLIHSSPPPLQTKERLLLVIAYSAPFMQTWSADTDPPATLRDSLTDDERGFVFGEARYKFRDQSEG
jgi:hypothetical protein